MRRTILLLPLVAAVATAQPQPLPVAATEAPITKYEPLAVFPTPTQQAVRGVASGSSWLMRMNQAQGRFLHGYRPAVRQAMEGGDELRQAFGALALAQAAKFTGDDRTATVAGQSILTLLTSTRLDPADPTCRVPTVTACNRIGFAAILSLSVYALPGPDDRLLAEADRLCHFLRKQCQPDGSIQYADGPDPAGANEYPGYALSAIVANYMARPDPSKADVAARTMTFYRAAFRSAPHPLLAATLIPAFADFRLQNNHAEAGAAALELADWLCGLQYPAAFPRNPTWSGGFRGVVNRKPADTEPTCDSAVCLAALGWAYQVTARNADIARAERYRQAAQDAALFVTALQYDEPNTRHFENTFRANVLIGGFHLSPSDGDLRVDATGRCVSGLLRYLASGAER
ncbi:MAG: hypothetical protein U0804_25420 [Gemmataceae bacterium]